MDVGCDYVKCFFWVIQQNGFKRKVKLIILLDCHMMAKMCLELIKVFSDYFLLFLIAMTFQSLVLMVKSFFKILCLLCVHIWACPQRKQARHRVAQLVWCFELWLMPSAQLYAPFARF